MNRNIQMLRGIACIYICLQHFSIFNSLGYGAIGVEVFFVLSGYLTMENLNRKNIDKTFLVKKCMKILPLYYIATMAVFISGICIPSLYSNLTFNLKNLICSLLLIPDNVFYIYVGWTLTYTFYFYTLFYIANIIAKKDPSHTFIWSCSLILTMYIISNFILPPNAVTSVLKSYNSPIMLEFLFGLCASFFKTFIEKYLDKIRNWIKVIMFIICIIVIFFFGWDSMQKRYLIPALIVTAIILLCITSDYNEENIFYKILEKIGNVSYTIYILHPLLIRPIDKALISFNLEKSIYLLAVFLCLCIVIILLSIADKLTQIIHTSRILTK